MSQNPAHSHRRALSPPAVTRFHLRTAPASEAVFAPPYVPARAGTQRYSSRRPAQPITYTSFPEPVLRSQPPALPPATRALELPLPPARAPSPEQAAPPEQPVLAPEPPPKQPDRAAPGTWRDIIARFELGEERPPPIEAAPEEREMPPVTEAPVEQALPDDVVPREAVPWEIEALTTPDYTAPHSIHDPEHDSWPVAAADGDAVPAWSADEAPAADEAVVERPVEPIDEIGELVLDDEVAAAAAGQGPSAAAPDDEDAERPADFPLNAFIVPAGVQHMPGGYDAEVAQLVAHRLDELARELRTGGLSALGTTNSVDELSRVLAAIVTGYVARDA